MYLCTFLYSLTVTFIFPRTRSGFNKKNIAHILDIVFITRPRMFLSEIHLKFFYGISGPQISYGTVVSWSMVCAFGRWSAIGWSVGRWLVVGGRLVGRFKKTRAC